MPDFTFLRRCIDLVFPNGPPYEPKQPSIETIETQLFRHVSTYNCAGSMISGNTNAVAGYFPYEGYKIWVKDGTELIEVESTPGYMDSLRNGDAENLDFIRSDVQSLKYIRNPENTPVLSDLEREFGISPQATLTDAERRILLKPEVYKRKTTGSTGDLQKRLDDGGYNLTVYDNSPDGPAIDPAIIIEQNYQMQALGGTNYYAGNTLAYAGFLGGTWLVNGRVFEQSRGVFGAGTIWAGNTNAVAGYYLQYIQREIAYPTPIDPDSWAFCFFVGGAGADINPATGELISIPQGSVPSSQQKQLVDVILKFKPLFTWCGLVVTFT